MRFFKKPPTFSSTVAKGLLSKFSKAGELPADDSCARSLIECVFVVNNPLLLFVGVSL